MNLDLDLMERSALLAMVGLAVAVMQNDTQNGPMFVDALSGMEMQPICQRVVEKLNAAAHPGVQLVTGD
jgi:hypothetical protein